MADHVVQTSYNAQHKIPWHWQVPAYLVAKGIGTGLFMILSLGVGLNLFSFEAETFVVAGFLSLLFVGINTGLLVMDLEKPARFLTILLRPQWRSWLARGAFLLSGFSALAGMWWMLEMGAYLGWLPETLAASVRPYALWIGLPLAIGSAIYTAFLFGQAEGRDLWQSSLLPIHMLVQALMVGAGMFLLIDFAMIIPAAIRQVAAVIFISALIIDLGMILLGEFGMPHASEIAAKAAHEISHGTYRKHFWGGGIVLGHIIPLVLLAVSIPLAAAAAALFAIIGLYFFEYAFVMAPQDVPNS